MVNADHRIGQPGISGGPSEMVDGALVPGMASAPQSGTP